MFVYCIVYLIMKNFPHVCLNKNSFFLVVFLMRKSAFHSYNEFRICNSDDFFAISVGSLIVVS